MINAIYETKGRAREYNELAINLYTGCGHQCVYCLEGNTLILKANMSTTKLHDVQIGDVLLGLETKDGLANTTKFVSSTVEAVWTHRKPVYEIILDNGITVHCSSDHRWLTDRGWKYTIGSMAGTNRRPYLTTNNYIRIATLSLNPTPLSTNEYRKGYLAGIIRGDGHLGKHGPYTRSRSRLGHGDKIYTSTEYVYQFILRLNDQDALARAKQYLLYFGIKTFDFSFTIKANGIRTSRRSDLETIQQLIEWSNHPEYQRGFMAGIYDAEGSFSSTIRIFNSDSTILSYIEKCLSNNDFNYTYDKPHKYNKTQSIRLVGGVDSRTRFWQWCNPAITRKRTLIGRSLKGYSKVKQIRPLGYERDLFDIQTSSGTFIANGMASHNCYGASVTHQTQESWKAPHPRAGILEAIERDAKKFKGEKRHILLCFVTDPYQPIDEELQITRQAIEILHRYDLRVMILTKGGARALRDFDLLTPNDSFATTLTCLDAPSSAKWEPYAAFPSERLASLLEAHKLGIPTWVSLEPVIYPQTTLDIIRANVPYIGHYKVGTMNYHPRGKEIDWHWFAHQAKAAFRQTGASYYMKKDLERYL